MVLTDGKSNGNNVLAVDEESNTIVEAADGSGVVMDSGGNIIAAGDDEGNVVLSDGEGNVIALSKEGNTIISSSKPQTVQARCLALMATSSRPGMPRVIWC